MGEDKECPCTDSSVSSNLSVSSISENGSDNFKNKNEIPISKYNDCNQFPENQFISTSCQPEISNLMKNEEKFCICQTFGTAGNRIPVNYKSDNSPACKRVNLKWPKSRYFRKKNKTYEVKLKKKRCQHYPKPYMFCELSEGIPQKKSQEVENSSENKIHQTVQKPTEKIDIYYFDHGNSAYFQTTDSPPILATEKCADKTENAATRFWAEIFAVAHIGCAFFTAFILQFIRFILHSTIRPLTVGILQMFADYFIKPMLSILFNALIQPFLIFFYNITTSIKDLCEPIAEAIGFFLREAANFLRAFRIVEINQNVEKGDKTEITACT
ncbi:uncharacterized protein LOC127288794 [Leptopilina boulardi]|uniref:uncharacterized protein LOC127288794 n=1 Tax=Leptopilina boulardi TaxID=63433 RepID=UPI0021F507E6|nr:uncharacterized protein LOC127288794 [Leptopilina boulardi]